MHQVLIDRLPLLPTSILPLELVEQPWFANKIDIDRVLPIIARPQSHQELEELAKFALSENLFLLPLGLASSQCVAHIPTTAQRILLLQPGFVKPWQTQPLDNRMVWFPAGLDISHAEDLIKQQNYTLSLWPEDYGTVGGNWALPRGSFQVKEFLMPAARRLGVEAYFRNSGWMKSLPVPRSASGPNISRSLFGFGGQQGYITQALYRISPLGEEKVALLDVTNAQKILENLYLLASNLHLPTWCSLIINKQGKGKLYWGQNIADAWTEKTWQTAKKQLPIKEISHTLLDLPAQKGHYSHLLRWRELETLLEKKTPLHLSGLCPEGLYYWNQSWPKPSVFWQKTYQTMQQF